MMKEKRLRGIAEIEGVHADAAGNVISREKITVPVSFIRDANGGAVDIREEE